MLDPYRFENNVKRTQTSAIPAYVRPGITLIRPLLPSKIMDARALWLKAAGIYFVSAMVMGLAFFVPAGTLDYWQAWAYLATVLIPAAIVMGYFLIADRAFLERRLRTREKEAEQRLIIKIALAVFIVAFITPGLDRRFGWSSVPSEVSLAADIVVLLGYFFVFEVFRENSYTGRTIQVDKGQKVITTGLYAIIRHPMYLGQLVLYLATPFALGSYVAVLPFLLNVPIYILRIGNEEEVLGRDLAGYTEYCKKTRFRLIPGIW